MWDEQTLSLLEAGFRVISYDRRGFGRSEQTASGYDYDTLAIDLKELISFLKLDKTALVGFSMGGGEVARYLSQFGGEKISCAAFVAGSTPFRKKTEDNPNGADEEKFNETKNKIKKDRFAFFHNFFKEFFGVTTNTEAVSPQALEWAERTASLASLKATLECVDAFGLTDLREDVRTIDIPTLIIHGTEDKIVPMNGSADLMAELLPAAKYIKYDGAPHGLNLTHKEDLNRDLTEFLKTHATERFKARAMKKADQLSEDKFSERH
jgi:non-heme chloroperoxidase